MYSPEGFKTEMKEVHESIVYIEAADFIKPRNPQVRALLITFDKDKCQNTLAYQANGWTSK